MARFSATSILGCWFACLFCTAAASSAFLQKRNSLHRRGGQEGLLGWLSRRQGVPVGCNCGARGGGKPAAGVGCTGAATGMMQAPTTAQPMAQPPIPPPPPPPPMAGPPPPLPPPAAKPLPGIPSMPDLTEALLPELGAPPLWKMTPPPTMPPMVTMPPTTMPPMTTLPWMETPLGLAPGTTPSPYAAMFTTRSPYAAMPTTPSPYAAFAAAPAPAPAPAAAATLAPLAPTLAPAALLQVKAGSWSPLSFLAWGRHSQNQAVECNCPCLEQVDRAFEGVLNQNLYR